MVRVAGVVLVGSGGISAFVGDGVDGCASAGAGVASAGTVAGLTGVGDALSAREDVSIGAGCGFEAG
jgi:hypothetical protein